MSSWILIAIVVVVIIVLALVAIYNRLISLKNTVDNAFSDIDVQIKKRFDLVGNLVNTVKWYATHEQETLEKVIQARTNFWQANTTEWRLEADNALSGTLKTLFAVSESYPELKANEGFLDLQRQLSKLEEQISSARRYLNATIRDYNIELEKFPNNIVAGLFGLKNQTNYFAITNEAEKETPKVEF